jgi:hypothetical protein
MTKDYWATFEDAGQAQSRGFFASLRVMRGTVLEVNRGGLDLATPERQQAQKLA